MTSSSAATTVVDLLSAVLALCAEATRSPQDGVAQAAQSPPPSDLHAAPGRAVCFPLGRALGGPLFSIAAGAIALGVWAGVEGTLLLFFALVNLLVGFGVLLPFPSVDGEVIWRELRRR